MTSGRVKSIFSFSLFCSVVRPMSVYLLILFISHNIIFSHFGSAECVMVHGNNMHMHPRL